MTSHLNLATLLADSAARHPTRPALVAGDTTLTFAMVDAFARTFAGALADLGVRPGEHVALLLPNVPQFTVAYFGAHYAGTPVVPLNVLLTADELAYHLEDSQATVVVAWEGFLGPLQEAMARVGTVRHVIVVRADLTDLSAPDGCHNLVRAHGRRHAGRRPSPDRRRRHRRRPLHVGHHRQAQGRRADPRQPGVERPGRGRAWSTSTRAPSPSSPSPCSTPSG